MKMFIIIFSINFFCNIGMSVENKTFAKSLIVAKPSPLIEEVPAPGVEPENISSTKVTKGTRDALNETKLGLIKTEKLHYDKSCKMVDGKIKCLRIKNKLKKSY